MILVLAIIFSLISLIGLVVASFYGLLGIYIARPLVDTSYGVPLLFGFRLTELVSVAVPLVTFLLIIMNNGTKRAVNHIPFFGYWMFYIGYVAYFSLSIAVMSSPLDGMNIFFRFMNGFAGFYLAQTYCRSPRQIKLFFLALVVAGVFPVVTGLIEEITGYHWKVTTAEGQVRNIGMYHDAITIRYYGLQAILGVAACFALKFPPQKVIRYCLFIMLVGALVIVYKALSKSGMSILFLWFVIWSIGRKSLKLPILAAIGVFLLIPFYFQEIFDTVFNIFHKEVGAVTGEIDANRTFAGRWVKWEEMYNRWIEFSIFQKLFGAGEIAIGAHNDYLQMLFHGGLIGLILYLVFLFSISIKLLMIFLRKMNLLSTLSLMVLAMWFVDSIGLVPSVYSGYQWFVWGVIGLCLRQEKNSVANEILYRRSNQYLKIDRNVRQRTKSIQYKKIIHDTR